jgi:hypothetical protein
VHRHEVESPLLPQGSSLLPGLCCPGPSSLNRPHPPHSQAHHDFTAWRLIRDVFAVRERRGDPRVVPSFHCTFLPDMPPSPTSGSPDIVSSKLTMPTWSSPQANRLDTPNAPARFVSRGRSLSRLHWFTICCGLSDCSPPRTNPTEFHFFFGHRRLLRPGFRRGGHPSRRWI